MDGLIQLVLHLGDIETPNLSFLVNEVFQLSEQSMSIDQVNSIISESEEG